MTVAHDAATESATFTTTTPFTFSHTPATTPQGVAVFIFHGTVSTDLINGTVSYGGQAMARLDSAADTTGEPGRVYVYHLANPPSGSQTVSISHTGSADVKIATAVTVTAATESHIAAKGKIEQNAVSPQVALNSGNESALRYCVVYSGLSLVTQLTLLASMSAVSDHDFGSFVGRVDRQTTASTGSFTIGYNSATDDVAFIGVALGEEPPEIGLMLGRSALIIP